jgi:hypothetical protein
MIAVIVFTVLVLAGFALTVRVRKYESNLVIFLVALACTVYVLASAINAVMLRVKTAPHVVAALVCVSALFTMMYRRRKRARGELS